MQITIATALRQIAGKDAAREDEKSKKKLEETKKKFISELRKHPYPLLERIGPENIWNALQKHIQDQIRRRNKAAGDDTERRLLEIKKEFLESVKKSFLLTDLNPEELWSTIQNDIRREIREHPGEWRSV